MFTFVGGLLPCEASGVVGVTEEAMEVLALIFEVRSATGEVGALVPIPKLAVPRKKKCLQLLSPRLLVSRQSQVMFLFWKPSVLEVVATDQIVELPIPASNG